MRWHEVVWALTTVLITGAIMTCSHACQAEATTDFLFRGMVRCNWKPNADWKGSFYNEAYLNDDAGRFFYYYSDIGAYYTGFASWLDVGAFYRHVRYTSGALWRTEYRPHADGVVRWRMGEYKLSNRLRMAYRIREKADDIWRLRDILTITFPWAPYGIKPYLSHEIFYNFDSGALETNESRAGCSLQIDKNLSGVLY
ncbi:MAG: DUF2490 domain-containing protein, partial [Elusimicrobia bacterium]|nr:DUF2490 domain-containing protein [Elusimicrobiota bacterium]